MEQEYLVIKPKKLRGEDAYRTSSIRLKEELFVQLEEIAGKTDRSRNELIGILLKFALQHCEIDAKQAECSQK